MQAMKGWNIYCSGLFYFIQMVRSRYLVKAGNNSLNKVKVKALFLV